MSLRSSLPPMPDVRENWLPAGSWTNPAVISRSAVCGSPLLPIKRSKKGLPTWRTVVRTTTYIMLQEAAQRQTGWSGSMPPVHWPASITPSSPADVYRHRHLPWSHTANSRSVHLNRKIIMDCGVQLLLPVVLSALWLLSSHGHGSKRKAVPCAPLTKTW